MTHDQAAKVVALLVAGFPQDALEQISIDLYVQELALLADPVAAMETARVVVRESERFPSLKAFRHTYHAVNARRREARQKLPPVLEDTRPPEWVQVWWWNRMTVGQEGWRPFPQQDGAHLAEDVLSIAEYEALRAGWVEAGSPSIRSARDLVAAIG